MVRAAEASKPRRPPSFRWKTLPFHAIIARFPSICRLGSPRLAVARGGGRMGATGGGQTRISMVISSLLSVLVPDSFRVRLIKAKQGTAGMTRPRSFVGSVMHGCTVTRQQSPPRISSQLRDTSNSSGVSKRGIYGPCFCQVILHYAAPFAFTVYMHAGCGHIAQLNLLDARLISSKS